MPFSKSTSSVAPLGGFTGMPRSAKAAGKVRSPSWNSRSSFNRQQQISYAHPPHSVRSSSSVPSSVFPAGSSGSATKKANSASAHITNELHEKLSDFTQESEGGMEEDDQHTHRYIAWLNYAVQDKEMGM
jgi:ATP-dependent exoDNAse (exonuclease V) beta subunit